MDAAGFPNLYEKQLFP